MDNPFQDLEQYLAGKDKAAVVTVQTISKLIKAAKKALPIGGEGIKVDSSQDGRKISLDKKADKKDGGASGSFKVCVHDAFGDTQDPSGDGYHYSQTISWSGGKITTGGNKELHIYIMDTHTIEAGHEPTGDSDGGGEEEDSCAPPDTGYTRAVMALDPGTARDLSL